MTTNASRYRVRLKYRARIEMGQSPPSTEYSSSSEDGLPFLQGTADFGASSPTPRVYCGSPTKLARAGDILFSVRAPVGNLNLADQEFGIGRGLCAIRPEQSWDIRFAWWALHEACHQLNLVSTGSTYDAVATEDVGNLLIETTSPGMQCAIADYLDRETARLDALVAAKERVLALLAEKRRAIITRAVTRGLDPNVPCRDSGIPWLGEIPAHWKIVALRFLVDLSSGATPDTGKPEYWDGEIPWVSPKDMKQNEITDTRDHISELALSECTLRLIEPGAVLIVVRGMILAHSFPTALNSKPVTINQDMKALRCCPTLTPHYLRDFFHGFEEHTVSLADSSAHGTRKLDTAVLGRLEIPLPPLLEQQQVVTYIDEATSRLDALESATGISMALLKERRAALIAAAMTGQIDLGSAS